MTCAMLPTSCSYGEFKAAHINFAQMSGPRKYSTPYVVRYLSASPACAWPRRLIDLLKTIMLQQRILKGLESPNSSGPTHGS